MTALLLRVDEMTAQKFSFGGCGATEDGRGRWMNAILAFLP